MAPAPGAIFQQCCVMLHVPSYVVNVTQCVSNTASQERQNTWSGGYKEPTLGTVSVDHWCIIRVARHHVIFIYFH